jgi:hypothetical protein
MRQVASARLTPGSPHRFCSADHMGRPAHSPTRRAARTKALRSPSPVLDNPFLCSLFVPMEVETIGVARSLGWKVHMRCADGYREGTKSIRRCTYRKQLDLETLVATRGPNFPLSRLESRLMCPACGSRQVTVLFEPPAGAGRARMGQ